MRLIEGRLNGTSEKCALSNLSHIPHKFVVSAKYPVEVVVSSSSVERCFKGQVQIGGPGWKKEFDDGLS